MDTRRGHEEELLITANDVARLFKVSPSTVRMWVAQDAIPFIRLGRLVRFRREEIENWLKDPKSLGSVGRKSAESS
jgi:excisionase family DNA binding protein